MEKTTNQHVETLEEVWSLDAEARQLARNMIPS
jgi:hypothetical protein